MQPRTGRAESESRMMCAHSGDGLEQVVTHTLKCQARERSGVSSAARHGERQIIDAAHGAVILMRHSRRARAGGADEVFCVGRASPEERRRREG
eukprot:scaffold48836_cov32-Tisochrysis_lutea.AAC.1